MKIIAVGMNYAQHNKELGHTQENSEPVIFMKPDSAILKDGKPFFVPDFSHEVHYETEVVVRICRLGKNIAPGLTTQQLSVRSFLWNKPVETCRIWISISI